jgi:uncharacterized protein with HEPN domain
MIMTSIEEVEEVKAVLGAAADEAALYAVHYCIQVIGEAANSLSGDAKTGTPDIPWRDIVAMRHKLVHHYQIVSPAMPL